MVNAEIFKSALFIRRSKTIIASKPKQCACLQEDLDILKRHWIVFVSRLLFLFKNKSMFDIQWKHFKGLDYKIHSPVLYNFEGEENVLSI